MTGRPMDRPLVSHIGIAVADLDAAVERYTQLLGRGPDFIREIADQKVKVAIFASGSSNEGSCGGRIELVSGTSENSPIQRFINKRGEGLHHLCIYVEDIESKLRELAAAGYRLIDETPRIGAEGGRVAFVHPSNMDGVLMELEEWAD